MFLANRHHLKLPVNRALSSTKKLVTNEQNETETPRRDRR